MTIKLYTSGSIAELINAPIRSLRWWLNRADPELWYVEPHAIANKTAGSDDVMIKLWHEDQIEEIRHGYARYVEHVAEQHVAAKTRRKEYLKEYNKRYYAEKRAAVPSDTEDDADRAERALQFLLQKSQ